MKIVHVSWVSSAQVNDDFDEDNLDAVAEAVNAAWCNLSKGSYLIEEIVSEPEDKKPCTAQA